MRDGSPLSVRRLAVLALAFAVSYAQLPLYSSDQNSYFLRGLARAGHGLLQADRLAQTADPVPAFSVVVSATYRVSEHLFYLYHIIILGVYFYAIMSIARAVFPIDPSTPTFLAFAAALTALHSSLAHATSVHLFGVDVLAPLHRGVASIDVIGLVFQPSVFAVFLILSVALFLCGRPFLSVLSLAFATTVHTISLLSGAALTLAYAMVLYRDARSTRKPALVAALALVAVLPTALYAYRSFASDAYGSVARGIEILVKFRLPHHMDPPTWFGSEALVQIGLVVAALVLVRGTRLFLVMLVTSLIGVALTLAQVVTGDLRLALVAPWRVSVVLIPISTACVLAWLASRLSPFLVRYGRASTGLAAAMLSALVISGVVSTVRKFEARRNNPAAPMMEYVRTTASTGDLYLIPVELQDFRLATGAPTFVDFKVHPFRGDEVVKWYERLQLARQFYEGEGRACDVLTRLGKQYGITHVVTPARRSGAPCPGLEARYRDAAYEVCEVHVTPHIVPAADVPTLGPRRDE